MGQRPGTIPRDSQRTLAKLGKLLPPAEEVALSALVRNQGENHYASDSRAKMILAISSLATGIPFTFELNIDARNIESEAKHRRTYAILWAGRLIR